MDEQKISSRVEQTVQSFEKDVPPPLDPWFFERMANRITHEKVDVRGNYDFLFLRILKPGLLAGLAALNILMMVQVFDTDNTEATGRESIIENLSSQYGLNITDTYLLVETGE